eukprot:scaffold57122_cov17-Tisochrysis_lutea.AAC.2
MGGCRTEGTSSIRGSGERRTLVGKLPLLFSLPSSLLRSSPALSHAAAAAAAAALLAVVVRESRPAKALGSCPYTHVCVCVCVCMCVCARVCVAFMRVSLHFPGSIRRQIPAQRLRPFVPIATHSIHVQNSNAKYRVSDECVHACNHSQGVHSKLA